MEKEKKKFKPYYVQFDENGKIIPMRSANHPSERGWKLTPDRIEDLSERGNWKKGKDLNPDKDYWEK